METALSRGDLLRLTWAEIDFETGTITPAGGRIKTGVEQIAPLTDAVRKILADIKRERRKVVSIETRNLVFVKDGDAIGGNQIDKAVKRACESAGIKGFVFHCTRHMAKTSWARAGIGVEAAMLAAGHASVEMHRTYVHLARSDIAKAFGVGAAPLRHGRRVKS